jgi:cytolysin-activating lysine-acyltransferase
MADRLVDGKGVTTLENSGPINGARTAAPGTTAIAGDAPDRSVPTASMRAGIEKLRHAVQLHFGQVVLATMNLPRYRHQTLADLAHLFVAPLMRDRVAIARKPWQAPDGSAVPDDETVVGIAFWATVSDAVDAKITEQIKAGVFPVRLGPDDWVSGRRPEAGDVGAREFPPAYRRASGEDRAGGGKVDRSGGGGEVARGGGGSRG